MTMTTRVVWTADRSGIGHASRPGHARTLCSVVAVAAAWSWPVRLRCETCAAAVDELHAPAPRRVGERSR